jgi:NAD(P)H-dependent FMN reductase
METFVITIVSVELKLIDLLCFFHGGKRELAYLELYSRKQFIQKMEENTMLKIGIIIGSTRPGRRGEAVARWVHEIAQKRNDAVYELVDIADFNLPLLDEPNPPLFAKYTKPHTLAWSAAIQSFDGYIFVTPEYNHAVSGALKNAMDFLFNEWKDKAAGIVSYGGGTGGARAAENLRLILSELHVASVRAQVTLSLFTDFENYSILKPAPRQEAAANLLFDQVIAWSGALKTLR